MSHPSSFVVGDSEVLYLYKDLIEYGFDLPEEKNLWHGFYPNAGPTVSWLEDKYKITNADYCYVVGNGLDQYMSYHSTFEEAAADSSWNSRFNEVQFCLKEQWVDRNLPAPDKFRTFNLKNVKPEDRTADISDIVNKLEKNIKSITTRLTSLENSKIAHCNRIDELVEEFPPIHAAISQLEEDSVTDDVETVKEDVEQLKSSKVAHSDQIDDLTAKLLSVQTAITELKDSKFTLDELTSEKIALETSNEIYKQRISDLTADLQIRQETNLTQQKIIGYLLEQFQTTNRRLNMLESKLIS